MSTNVISEDERTMQKKFWVTYGSAGTIEDMFLHNEARAFDELDRPEILDAMGSVEGKHVLELGAGIGRFTGCLAETAKHVVSCDFMDIYTKRNQEANGRYSNITFLTADATQMDFGNNAHDLVFVNWLLQYLTDEEVLSTMTRILAALTDDGVFFFRESCHCGIGNRERDFDTTRFRDVAEYFKFLDKAVYKSENGKSYKFRLEKCACSKTFVILKKSHSQIYWKLTKMEANEDPSSQDMLDFYSKRFVIAAEKLYGEGFTSPGGLEGVQKTIKRLNFKKGQSVLDIGCGLGTADFLMAKKYGVNVLGMDITQKMFIGAIQSACSGKHCLENGNVFFVLDDCQTCEFDSGIFNIVVSFTAILHIPDKERLYKKIFNWLKPGGQLLITDFCKKQGEISEDFAADNRRKKYYLLTIENYGALLKQTGFVDVLAEDTTESVFIPSLYSEMKKGKESKEEIIKESGEDSYNEVIKRWDEKIARATDGELKLGLFTGRKPVA
eukprot:g3396.t1